ncbi:MAG TPA: cytochrome P460 family protein [Kofleriaceae bacterium]|nr:cytochrome P460 family protein [Kofleriaceae bacterium]
MHRFVCTGVVRIGLGLGLALGLVAGATPARAGGDAAAGKTRSLACQACHVAIPAASDTPHLAGQRESYLAKELKAFKSGDRKNPLMNAIASQLSDADIANLAAYWGGQAAGSDATAPAEIAAAKQSQMAFPRDFPKGFQLYGTANKEDQATVSKSYVNTAGFAAVKAGKPLPDGSVILVVNFAAKLDANKKPALEKDGSWSVDKIMGYAGMEARAGWGKNIPDLLRNADWNYGVFGPDKAPRSEINQAVCLACHKPQAATSYLFLLKDIQAKAAGK